MNTKRATLTIITILGLLAFASASGAYGPHLITATENTVHCRPQNPQYGSSENLWTCTDYYGNQFRNLLILSKD